MKWFLIFSLPFCCMAQTTLLCQADALAEKYNAEVAKTSSPSLAPQTDSCLEMASVWFSLDLNQLAVPKGKTALDALSSDSLLGMLKEIGIEGIYLENLRHGFSIDPQWGTDWTQFSMAIKKKNLALIGDSLGNSTELGADFELALQNVGEYPSLYHLIEIDQSDWKLLPHIPSGEVVENVPWLSLQELHKKGYVPEQYSPYTKRSCWNTTAQIAGIDGKTRRWIYLKEKRNRPVLAWLSPSFGANRIAAGDSLHATYELGQKIACIDGGLPSFAKQINALWIRKLGAFSAQKIQGGIKQLQQATGDLAFDILTRAALLHALIAEDAEALRLIYRLFQCEGIALKRLVHSLQPFDRFACDWAEFLAQPKKKYRYWQDQVTGEILRQRLLKEDLYRLGKFEQIPSSTWPGYCAAALGYKDAEQHRAEIEKAHLLLAFTYAMQPGVFSLSAADLLGALPDQAKALDLTGPNPATLYASLPNQLRNPSSFASQIRHLLEVRRKWNLAKAEILEIPQPKHQGSLLFIQRLLPNRVILVSAVNFSRAPVEEKIDLPAIRNSTAIELMSGLAEKKVFDSSEFSFSLSPLSGKVFLFQQKYYD